MPAGALKSLCSSTFQFTFVLHTLAVKNKISLHDVTIRTKRSQSAQVDEGMCTFELSKPVAYGSAAINYIRGRSQP